jgi:hypothetical protein
LLNLGLLLLLLLPVLLLLLKRTHATLLLLLLLRLQLLWLQRMLLQPLPLLQDDSCISISGCI